MELNIFVELTVLGDLKLEGPLMENNKPRIVLLFQTMLIITKKKEDNRLQYKNFIHVRDILRLNKQSNIFTEQFVLLLVQASNAD